MVTPKDKKVSLAASMAGDVAHQPSLNAINVKGNKRPAAKSKKEQLLVLIAKPSGAKISVLTERLGWQAHTVRAALSGLRKRGYQVLATKAPKTGEAVYCIVSTPQVNADHPQVAASEV
jgi:predicted dithiol-disulfide oxidoreductase (DUF899 family)